MFHGTNSVAWRFANQSGIRWSGSWEALTPHASFVDVSLASLDETLDFTPGAREDHGMQEPAVESPDVPATEDGGSGVLAETVEHYLEASQDFVSLAKLVASQARTGANGFHLSLDPRMASSHLTRGRRRVQERSDFAPSGLHHVHDSGVLGCRLLDVPADRAVLEGKTSQGEAGSFGEATI